MYMQKMIKYAIFGAALATMSAGCASTKNDRHPEKDANAPQAVIIQDDADVSKTDIEQPAAQPQEPKDSKIIVKYEEEPYAAPGQTRLFFPYDSSTLGQDDLKSLEALANWLKDHPKVNIYIEGHADERGSTAYNLALGERRAQAVQRHLMAMGIEKDRLNLISYGEELPLAKGDDPVDYKKNRRVEFEASSASLSFK